MRLYKVFLEDANGNVYAEKYAAHTRKEAYKKAEQAEIDFCKIFIDNVPSEIVEIECMGLLEELTEAEALRRYKKGSADIYYNNTRIPASYEYSRLSEAEELFYAVVIEHRRQTKEEHFYMLNTRY